MLVLNRILSKNRNFTTENNFYVSGMLTEINLYMPYSCHKLVSISPDCSYLGQLVISRCIVKSFLNCTDHTHLIAQNFVNILSTIKCIFIKINGSFNLLWSGHNQLEAFCTADDELSC